MERIGLKRIVNLGKKIYHVPIWLGMLFLIIFYFFAIRHFQNDCRSMVQDIKQQLIIGKVTNKFVDEKNHALLTITYKDEKNHIKNINYGNDKSGFMEYVNPGDSINKQPNSLLFKVYRINQVESFNLDFECGF